MLRGDAYPEHRLNREPGGGGLNDCANGELAGVQEPLDSSRDGCLTHLEPSGNRLEASAAVSFQERHECGVVWAGLCDCRLRLNCAWGGDVQRHFLGLGERAGSPGLNGLEVFQRREDSDLANPGDRRKMNGKKFAEIIPKRDLRDDIEITRRLVTEDRIVASGKRIAYESRRARVTLSRQDQLTFWAGQRRDGDPAGGQQLCSVTSHRAFGYTKYSRDLAP